MSTAATDRGWITPALAEQARAQSDELLARYASLVAQPPASSSASFGSAFPADRDAPVRSFFAASGRGHWIGKAYRPDPEDPSRGEGLNLWGHGARIERSERFAWEIGPSAIDGQPALVMTYAAYRNLSGAVGLVDEVRRLDDGLYLGLYRTRIAVPPFTRRQAGRRSEPEVFLLAGPAGPWVGPDSPTAELGRWRPTHAALRALLGPPLARRLVGRGLQLVHR